ncbi:secreted protein [Streptomyces xiamenensis]|uniref:Secreted protein n=1 Tax=Streptomyces xiamenensis TaxID=408015 RepID=A0A0F7CQ64_9ACTN|nr:secreted protein [Streptomyces xiamenensis]
MAWRTPTPDLTAFRERVKNGGIWIFQDSLVQVLPELLVSRDLATGEKRWSMQLAAGQYGCGSSARINEGRIAVLSGMYCEYLIVVDLATGSEVALIELQSARLASYGTPALLGDTVAVSSGEGSAGFRISDGEQLWWTEPRGQCAETSFTVLDEKFVSRMSCGVECNDLGRCGFGYESTGLRATTESGEELWRWKFDHEVDGSRLDILGVISVEPLVILAELGRTFDSTRIFLVEDPRASVLRELSYDPSQHDRPCGATNLWLCNAVVGGNYMALRGEGDTGMSIVDLTTGDIVGDIASEGGRPVRPVAMVEGEFLAYRQGEGQQPGRLVAIDPERLSERTVMALDASAAAAEHDLWRADPDSVRMFWDSESGAFVMGETAFAADRLGQPDHAVLVYR